MKKLTINPSNKRYYSDEYIRGWEDGVKAQYEATKDYVKVVRCKDCIYADPNEGNVHWVVCKIDKAPTFDDDFCSNGKRREEGEVEK